MTQMTKGTKISLAIKDFFSLFGTDHINGDLIARINPTLLKVAWELIDEDPVNFSGFSLINEWNRITGGACITRTSVDTFIAYFEEQYNGTDRQKYIADAIRIVFQNTPPSSNKDGGKLNSMLINLSWKLLKKYPNLSTEEFAEKLEEAVHSATKNPNEIKFRTPSKYKIKHQDVIQKVTKGVVAELKEQQVQPFTDKVTTQLAGTLNAVAWKFHKLGKCTHENIMNFIRGKDIPTIKKALQSL